MKCQAFPNSRFSGSIFREKRRKKGLPHSSRDRTKVLFSGTMRRKASFALSACGLKNEAAYHEGKAGNVALNVTLNPRRCQMPPLSQIYDGMQISRTLRNLVPMRLWAACGGCAEHLAVCFIHNASGLIMALRDGGKTNDRARGGRFRQGRPLRGLHRSQGDSCLRTSGVVHPAEHKKLCVCKVTYQGWTNIKVCGNDFNRWSQPLLHPATDPHLATNTAGESGTLCQKSENVLDFGPPRLGMTTDSLPGCFIRNPSLAAPQYETAASGCTQGALQSHLEQAYLSLTFVYGLQF